MCCGWLTLYPYYLRCVSLLSEVYIFIKFHGSHSKIRCAVNGSVVNGKHWAKVPKKSITEKKMAKIENPYLNAHLHINLNSHI